MSSCNRAAVLQSPKEKRQTGCVVLCCVPLESSLTEGKFELCGDSYIEDAILKIS